MDPQDLIHGLIKGALGGRRKPGRRALRALSGGRNPLLTPSALLTLGGLAWGVIEAATQRPGGAGSQGPQPPAPPPPAVPPVPASGSAAAAVPEGVLRLVRLTISAARADGTLHDSERRAILEQAEQAGALALVEAELERPRPLAEIVRGVDDPNRKQDLYVLAFTIVRADLSVGGAERVYLAQLAHALGLTPEEARALEELAAARIDSEEEGA